MKKELEDKFVERWPKWFDVKGDLRHTLMGFGFECGDGWFDLLWNLCEKLDSVVPDNFEVLQVKEKFGGLRFYISGGTDAVYDLINAAEVESERICELCGKIAKVQEDSGWLRALCAECGTRKD